MNTEKAKQILNDLLNFKFDLDYMSNSFDYNIVYNDLSFKILVERKHYRHALKLFIDGMIASEDLRAWVYYMDQTMAFTTNPDLDGEDNDVLLNIRDQISATIIDGPLTVDMAKSFLNEIKDDWKPKK